MFQQLFELFRQEVVTFQLGKTNKNGCNCILFFIRFVKSLDSKAQIENWTLNGVYSLGLWELNFLPNAITSQVYLLKLQVVYTTTLCKFPKASILGVESLFQVCPRAGRLCPPISTHPFRFSDLPTSLFLSLWKRDLFQITLEFLSSALKFIEFVKTYNRYEHKCFSQINVISR